MTRKEFLKSMGIGASALFCASQGYAFWPNKSKNGKSIKGHVFKGDAPSKPWKWSIEAFHYTKGSKEVQCQVCPNRCILSPGDRSVCRSKVNIGGKLYSLTYGNPCSTSIFSIATTGCNFRCLNCQNWEISQRKPEEVRYSQLFPPDVVRAAKKANAPSIAYTYSEAITYYEYMYDTSKLAREAGLKNVLVSNGYINKKPLLELCKYLDGANINLKSYDNRIYLALNGGTLWPVLNAFKTFHQEGVKRMCGWILEELGPDYPLHFLRFFPQYKLTRLPPTPIKTLEEFRNLALKEGIHYVYLGNVPGHEGCHTYCHNCGKILIERRGYFLGQFNLEKGRCKFCNTKIPGRWT
jgi:pyruvate formate lyase activating enzyme